MTIDIIMSTVFFLIPLAVLGLFMWVAGRRRI